jgi:hypothetical protein
MKFYAIPPNRHLDMMHNGDSYFCLAHHFFNDEAYRNYFLNLRNIKPNAFITLDNGAAEESLVTEEILLEAVKELQPNEVIAPDVLFDKAHTLDNFYSFVAKMKERGLINKTDIFACPQGTNRGEWLTCYKEMVLNDATKCIGLSKIAVPKCWNDAVGDQLIAKSRVECMMELKQSAAILKPIHLLGMGEHDEFDYYLNNKIPNIRSSDSCYTILAAMNGISFEEGNITRVKTTNEYFNAVLDEETKALAIKNIHYLRQKYKEV